MLTVKKATFGCWGKCPQHISMLELAWYARLPKPHSLLRPPALRAQLTTPSLFVSLWFLL